MTAYYNEIDPYAAQWLRNLIAAGHIAPGDVDERSIEDVRPDDLTPYTQCHFFAGIGGWSYALRLAGWPDDRPVWTGSCPCQPFSSAGKGAGFADERHLWPALYHLIGERRPDVVFGEQVASNDGLSWLDLVQADLEEAYYAFGAFDLCAAGFGAPHIRQRLYWVAYNNSVLSEQGRALGSGRDHRGDAIKWARPRSSGELGRLADFDSNRRPPSSVNGVLDAEHYLEPRGGFVGLDDDDGTGLEGQRRGYQVESGRVGTLRPVAETGEFGGMAGPWKSWADWFGMCWNDCPGGNCRCHERRDAPIGYEWDDDGGWMADNLLQQRQDGEPGKRAGDDASGRIEGSTAASGFCGDLRPGPTNGFWGAADWLHCRDGKWRPVEPRPQPMVDGSTESLGRVRPGQLEDLELEVAEWAIRHQADAREALLDLRRTLSEEALRGWAAGRLPGLHEAPVLLAFLRQLEEQGWAFAECVSGQSTKVAQERLRVLWGDGAPARASCERGLDGQPPGERADALRLLSSVLARHAQEAWGAAYEPYAAAGFPLAHGARTRVGRLRGYGNAIVPQVAATFVGAYLDRHLHVIEMSDLTTDTNQQKDIFS